MVFLYQINCYCEPGLRCNECDLITSDDTCYMNHSKLPNFYCDFEKDIVKLSENSYFYCIDKKWFLKYCENGGLFDVKNNECYKELLLYKKVKRSSGGARAGDICQFNTDCQTGMFCSSGICTCLSDYVSISGYCWPKVNPGQSGCHEDKQCSVVWPNTRCSPNGICECSEGSVASKTRDGTVCITSSIPPACPLPESSDNEPNPSTLLANSKTHPLSPGNYMPILCTSTSTEVFNSNGGDGSTWCIYPDGDNDVYIADIYDCLETPQVNNKIFKEYATTVNGICCPSRAFVCIQPMEQGDEPSIPRWYYNPISGACSQFMWDPNIGDNVSPNNFKTQEHCETYCGSCKRGPTQYHTSKHSILEDTSITNCMQSSTTCSSEFQCTLIGSTQSCCPSISNICSPYGGRPHFVKPLGMYDRGVPIHGSKTVTRYYYDANVGKCINFLYDGLGNFNNFITKFDCENYCSRLMCPFGNPLTVGEEWQRCEGNTECPSSHLCDTTHKVCCPTAQNICSQPKRLGECKQSVRKYWYNIEMRQCQLFEYSGCNGNDNNFDSLTTCQQTCRNISLEPKCPQGRAYRDINGNYFICSPNNNDKKCPPNYNCYFDGNSYGCCPTKSYTCSLNSDKGVQCGAGTSFKYYFNPNKNTCEAFQYLGCDGNSNNFQTLEACEEYCGIVCPHGGQPLRDVSTNQLITCSNSNKCIDTHECVTLNSNGNVVQRCCPSKSYICSMPPQQGTLCTKMPITRYYFNIVTKECAKFSYNGCNGNLNNWPSIEQCKNFCHSSACIPGDIAYINPNTNLPYQCNPSLTNTCPKNFKCLFDSLTQSSVCCGATSMNVCPDNEKAFVNAADMTVRECLVNVEGSCPENYLCRFNPQKNRYYCCSSVTGEFCPSGKAVARDNLNKYPMRCNVNDSNNQCPNGYSCQTSISGVLQGYCCSNNYVCPNKGDFYIEENSQMPRSCTPGAFIGCPTGYSCQASSSDLSKGYCCKGQIISISDGCPPNEYVYMKNNKVIECDPFNPANSPCPKSYTCQWGNQKYQCCGKEPILESIEEPNNYGCPNFQVAFINKMTKSPEVCSTSGPNTCPIGYFCQFVTNYQSGSNQYICCGNKSGCPGDSVGYIDISGSPKECKIGHMDECPKGFSCKGIDNKKKYVCCTNTEEDDYNVGTSELVRLAMNPTSITNQNTTISKSKRLRKQQRLLKLANVTLPPLPNISTKKKIKKCQIKETIKNKKCTLRIIGDKCIKTIQCPETTQCLNNRCLCPSNKIEKDGKCIDVIEEVNEEEYFEYEVEYDDEIVTCKTNEIKYDNKCYKKVTVGEKCEIENQCINGAKCINNLCYCPKNTAGYKKRCLTNICGISNNRTPVLSINSKALLCQRKSCPSGSTCLKSAMINDYICCSTIDGKGIGSKKIVRKKVPLKKINNNNIKKNTIITMEGSKCKNEMMPLLEKYTKNVVFCSNKKLCPKNYVCIEDQCCREETKIFSGIYMDAPNIILPPKSDIPICDENSVLVTYDDNGQNVYSCEIECPDRHSPIDGICISDK